MAAATYIYVPGQNSGSLIDQSTAMYGALLAAITVISFVFIMAVADLRSWYVPVSVLVYLFDNLIFCDLRYYNLSGIMAEVDRIAASAEKSYCDDEIKDFLKAYLEIRGNAVDRSHAKALGSKKRTKGFRSVNSSNFSNSSKSIENIPSVQHRLTSPSIATCATISQVMPTSSSTKDYHTETPTSKSEFIAMTPESSTKNLLTTTAKSYMVCDKV